jgi:hypothetical protein
MKQSSIIMKDWSIDEIKKFYEKCKNYIHKIIRQQKKLGNEFKNYNELFNFLINDPNTPEWLPLSREKVKSKFRKLGSFSIVDFTGLETKLTRTNESRGKLYKKCQKYAQKLVKKYKFQSEIELYNFTKNDPNTPSWYEARLYRNLNHSIEDFTGISNYTSSNRKWVTQEELAKEIQKIISKRKIKIKVGKGGLYKHREMFEKIKKLPEYKADWPKSPYDVYGKEFKGKSYLIMGMTEEELYFVYPMDKCIKLAQIVSQENNIRDLKEWTDAMITCGPIYGLPTNVMSGFRKFDENGKLIPESIKYPNKREWLGQDGPWKYERDYEKALLISVPFCKKNKITDGASWDMFIEKFPNKHPETLSSVPDKFFNDLWKREKITKFAFHWGTWTGSGIISTMDKMRMWLPWPEAKKEYQRLEKEYGLKRGADWFRFAKKNPRLLEKLRLPVDPSTYTKERVWKMEYGKKDI